jgi:hypothetical protein
MTALSDLEIKVLATRALLRTSLGEPAGHPQTPLLAELVPRFGLVHKGRPQKGRVQPMRTRGMTSYADVRTITGCVCMYVCCTEVQCSFTHASSDNLSESAPDTPRRRFLTCGARPRRSLSETVSAKSTTQTCFRMRRITRRDRIRLAVPVPKLQTRLESDGKRPIVAKFRTIPTPRIFADKLKQIPQKESARDKNLQTRPSTLDIPHASGNAFRCFTLGASDLTNGGLSIRLQPKGP